MSLKKTILIVDDAATNRKLLAHLLKAHNYNVLEAENGKVALDILKAGEDFVSLVLLDLTMPIMNGYELLEIMKADEKLNSVPVIVMTGNDAKKAEALCFDKGATDFVTKPYNEEIICRRIESILRLIDNTAIINRLETDNVTGLYNREAFYRHVEIMLEENPDEEFDIICSNIEGFKVINSKYGTKIGDDLLRYIANHNIKCVTNEGVCGRNGADNFVALRKRRKMRTQEEVAIAYEKVFKNAPVKGVFMQYGLYPVTDRTVPVSAMCDRAMMALSSIRHQYGVYYCVYDDSMRQKVLRDHLLTEKMEQALNENQFLVYLQPKHDVQTGKVAGAEALVRWIHPELGFISPGEFIPLFEKNGFITKLDLYMWNKVCKILKLWLDMGKKIVPVSVNASRADFSLADLPKIIVDMVDSYKIPHSVIHFEVTESAYTDNPQQIISTVKVLRSMGFVIEMDDFGSGYSSLNMLSELPIDILKLDMKFMQNDNDIGTTSKRSILSFAVSLSKWLHLVTIAEGVENEEEVEFLKTMGCNYIQGYYFAKPMPISEFEVYMEKDAENHADEKVTSDAPRNNKTADENAPLILIAEDVESNRELLIEMLKPYYHVAAFENGADALDFINKHSSELTCILLDLLMPIMSGFQVIEAMQKSGIINEIPVIITSEMRKDSELNALRLGAESFVAKPYNPEVLLHHVKSAIHEHDYRILSGKNGVKL